PIGQRIAIGDEVIIESERSGRGRMAGAKAAEHHLAQRDQNQPEKNADDEDEKEKRAAGQPLLHVQRTMGRPTASRISLRISSALARYCGSYQAVFFPLMSLAVWVPGISGLPFPSISSNSFWPSSESDQTVQSFALLRCAAPRGMKT